MCGGIWVKFLGWSSKGSKIQIQKKKKESSERSGNGFSADKASDPQLQKEPCLKCCSLTPCSQHRWLMTHIKLYTLRQTTRQRECQSLGLRKRRREKMCKTCNDRTRKESITPDFDLVTVTAYNDFLTPKPWTLQPYPNLQYCVSRHSANFCPENFLCKLFGQGILHLTNSKESA